MTLPTTEIPQDRIERLADRVLVVAKDIAAKGDGRTFTADAIYDAMPDVNRQRIKDAIKTLKDARRIHAIGFSRGARGVYEIEKAYPSPRQIFVGTMTDGYRLIEVGDAVAVPLTPQEAATLGSYLAGDAMRLSLYEKMQSFESVLQQEQLKTDTIKQQQRMIADLQKQVHDLLRSSSAQMELVTP